MSARRVWAWPLVPLYAAGLAVKDGLRAAGVLRTRTLKWPVVSVGSLSAGGAGKTPVVIALAELLSERGWRVDVLSRGYGREGREQPHDRLAAQGDHGGPGVLRVDGQAEGAAARFGDEPVLIARRAGVPVWVSGERYAAGSAAEEETESSAVPRNDTERRVHLLDDGFQHRALARAVDVVVVTAEDLNDALLPAGNRREPLRALGRADAVVLREEEREEVEAQVRRLVRVDTAVWSVRRGLELEPGSGAVVAFCGIARPEGFWAMLAAAGVQVVERVAFGDHHAYGLEDVERLAGLAKQGGASGFVTTEKDAVKLSAGMRERLGSVGLVRVARLEARFVDEAEVMRGLEARIG